MGNRSPMKVAEMMQEIRAVLKKDDEIIHFVYPVTNQETKIECLNPKLMSEEDYQQAKNVLEKNQAIITRLLSEKMGL